MIKSLRLVGAKEEIFEALFHVSCPALPGHAIVQRRRKWLALNIGAELVEE